MIETIFTKLGEDYTTLQENIADIENDFLMWLFGVSVLTLGSLKSTIDGVNNGGINAKDASVKQAFDLRYELQAALKNAWITAVLNKKAAEKAIKSTPEMVRAKFKKIKNRIKLTTTNTIDTAAENVRYQFTMHYKAINALIHISVLDNKTSSICTARNGCMWDKKTKDGLNTDLPFELPPLHPNYRSHIYGLSDKQKPDFVKGKSTINGQEWIKSRSLEQLQEQFGKQAGQMLKNGEIDIYQAIDRYGLKRLTLKAIQDKLQQQLSRFNRMELWAKEVLKTIKKQGKIIRNTQHTIGQLVQKTQKQFCQMVSLFWVIRDLLKIVKYGIHSNHTTTLK